jgi:hypothetical protein
LEDRVITEHTIDLDLDWLDDDNVKAIEFAQENHVVGIITAHWSEESYEDFDQHGGSYPSTAWKLWTWTLEGVLVNGHQMHMPDLPAGITAAFDAHGCEKELMREQPRGTR